MKIHLFHHTWLRSLLEAWLVSLVSLGVLLSLDGQLETVSFNSGIFFTALLAPLWAAVRCRLPAQWGWRQSGMEVLRMVSWSVWVPVSLFVLLELTGWTAVLARNTTGAGGASSLMMLALFSPVFLIYRGLAWCGLRWQRLRRERFVFELTHTLLKFIFLTLLVLALVAIVIWLVTGDLALSERPGSGAGAWMVARWVGLVLPVLAVFAAAALVGLLVFAPLAGGLAYQAARRLTGRVEALSEAMGKFQSGHFDTRIPVVGQDELAHLQAGFNQMAETQEKHLRDLNAERERVTRLLENRRKLFAEVSHELRTPIATLRAYLDSDLEAGREPTSEDLRQDMNVMRQEVDQMQRLIDDLFALARVEVEHLELRMAPLVVKPLLERVQAAFSPLAWRQNRLDIALQVEENLPRIQVDENRLEQVIANLVRNSLRHARSGSVVALLAQRVAVEGTVWVEISVWDTGSGILPEEISQVWERYYQGSDSRAGGAGIGLALVKELTEAMGGAVAVESNPQEGTCFKVRYPAL